MRAHTSRPRQPLWFSLPRHARAPFFPLPPTRVARRAHLDQAFLEHDLDDLLENRQEAAVVDPNPLLEEL